MIDPAQVAGGGRPPRPRVVTFRTDISSSSSDDNDDEEEEVASRAHDGVSRTPGEAVEEGVSSPPAAIPGTAAPAPHLQRQPQTTSSSAWPRVGALFSVCNLVVLRQRQGPLREGPWPLRQGHRNLGYHASNWSGKDDARDCRKRSTRSPDQGRRGNHLHWKSPINAAFLVSVESPSYTQLTR